MTISLEHIAPEDWGAVERMRQTLQGLVVDTGGQSVSIRFGVDVINAATLHTINHGLGRTPIVVVATAANSGVALGVDLFTSTTFRLANASATNTTGYWVAIG